MESNQRNFERNKMLNEKSYIDCFYESRVQLVNRNSDDYVQLEDETNSWISQAVTNTRYQLSSVPEIPYLGCEWVRFKRNSPSVVLLGRQYRPVVSILIQPQIITGSPKQVKQKFMEAFKQLIWVTYRKRFRQIPYKITSDTGWGCTIRVGQMMLINTLKYHFKRQFSEIDLIELLQQNKMSAPFSLHRFCETGNLFGRTAGNWYSPSTVCQIMNQLLNIHPMQNLKPIVVRDSLILKQEIFSIASENKLKQIRKICLCPNKEECQYMEIECTICRKEVVPIEWKNAVFMMVPLMLGIRKLDLIYTKFLQIVFRLKSCVGIIGGRPRSALYFVGFQGENFLFLDPHYVQNAVFSREDLQKNLQTYHCESPKLLYMGKAESSMAVGFYFENKQQFQEFQAVLQVCQEHLRGVISLRDRIPDYLQEDDSEDEYCVL